MSDPTHQQAAGQQEPTEEELQAYFEQLRQADAAQIVAQAFELLGTGAQVKLGRPDARALIDALVAMTEATSAVLPDELAQQMRSAISQLQTAQVQAERDTPSQGTGGAGAGAGAATGQAGAQPGSARPGAQEPAGEDSEAGQRMTDRLWIPGREPGPEG